MRKHSTLALVLIGLAAVLVLIFAVARKPSEPSYQGKRLGEWLADTRFTDSGRVVLSDASVRAVRETGTNALPSLMTMLGSSDSQLKLRVIMLLQRQHLVQFHIPTSGEK